MSQRIFLYGTLQPEFAPVELEASIAQLRLIAIGSTSGYLYDLGGYPGAVIETNCATRIYGSIYEISADRKLLEVFDAYEEFDPADATRSLFVRRLCMVRLKSGSQAGEEVTCWIYQYNRAPGEAPLLMDGHYRRKPA